MFYLEIIVLRNNHKNCRLTATLELEDYLKYKNKTRIRNYTKNIFKRRIR
jgi:hypothetical protein